MNAPANSDVGSLQRWAPRQLADYDSRQPGTLFSDGVTLNLQQAYELQSAVARLRCERGEGIIGYKVGCTSPTIRSQLGIDHCISGRLYDSEQHNSGTELRRREFANLAIEGELAVELAHEPNENDFTDGIIPGCVARVFPVIELHNHVMRGELPSASELIANNAINAGFVGGDGVTREDLSTEELLNSATLSIFSNDRLLDHCSGRELIQTITSSLKWLAASLQGRGEHLQPGEVILTGSIPSLIPIVEDCVVRVDAPPFGVVEATFIT